MNLLIQNLNARSQVEEPALLRLSVYGLVFFALVTLGVKIILEKHLSLDGVNYFYWVLKNRDFTHVAWSRQYAEYVNEWVLVAALNLGVNDIPRLIQAYGLGLYIVYIASFLICIWARRDSDFLHLVFPLASLFLINSISDYDLACEHHVMSLLSWPIVFLLTRSCRLSTIDIGLIIGLLCIFTRTYETGLLLGVIFIFVIILRIRSGVPKREKAALYAAILLCVITIVIGISFVLWPRSPTNKANFVDSIYLLPRNLEAITALLVFSLLSVNCVISGTFKKVQYVIAGIALLLIANYIYVRATSDYALSSWISFGSRTFAGIFLPALHILFMMAVLFPRCFRERMQLTVFAIFFIIMQGFSTYDTKKWVSVKEAYQNILESNYGFVEVDSTALVRDPYKDYIWDWNHTQLGLVWSESCVKTIFLNGPQIWQPVDLEKPPLDKHRKYSRYLSEYWNYGDSCTQM
jgi:hypothetical protein